MTPSSSFPTTCSPGLLHTAPRSWVKHLSLPPDLLRCCSRPGQQKKNISSASCFSPCLYDVSISCFPNVERSGRVANRIHKSYRFLFSEPLPRYFFPRSSHVFSCQVKQFLFFLTFRFHHQKKKKKTRDFCCWKSFVFLNWARKIASFNLCDNRVSCRMELRFAAVVFFFAAICVHTSMTQGTNLKNICH